MVFQSDLMDFNSCIGATHHKPTPKNTYPRLTSTNSHPLIGPFCIWIISRNAWKTKRTEMCGIYRHVPWKRWQPWLHHWGIKWGQNTAGKCNAYFISGRGHFLKHLIFNSQSPLTLTSDLRMLRTISLWYVYFYILLCYNHNDKFGINMLYEQP